MLHIQFELVTHLVYGKSSNTQNHCPVIILYLRVTLQCIDRLFLSISFIYFLIKYISYLLTYSSFYFNGKIDNQSINIQRAIITNNNMTLIIADQAWDILPSEDAEISAFDSKNNMAVSYTPLTLPTILRV